MNKKVLLAALLSVATVFGASAQKLVGNLSPLKGQKQVNLVIEFSETLLANGKSEAKFLEETTAQKTEAEKEKLLKEWNDDMRTQAHAMVAKSINDKVGKKHFMVGEFPEAEYTIVVKVKEIQAGFYAVVAARASEIKSEVSFIRTGETTPFATIEYKKTSNYYSKSIPYWITRITMSFAQLGAEMGAAMNKGLK